MLSDIEAMAIQAEALFVHDGQNRIVRLNTPLYIAAPKLFLGLTLEGHVIRLNCELPDCLATRLSALSRSEPVPDVFLGFPARKAGYRRKGYATEAVAAWAGAVQAMGLMPLYSTSWDNAAPMKVAEKLAMR